MTSKAWQAARISVLKQTDCISLREKSLLADFISKFQVIVITHDVDLLDALSRGTQIEHYHKVSRDENGESIVNKTAVSTR